MDVNDIIEIAQANNDIFRAGMAANESATTRKLARLIADCDEALYQLARMGPHPALDHVRRLLRRGMEEARK